MPTILRSSAVGKLRLGRTTTVPSPRSSGSRAGYRTAKVRCSSSKGTIGGADHIAKDNQSVPVRASPDFSGSSSSAASQWAGGGGRADLPAAGGRLLPPGGRRPGPAPPVPRGGPVLGRGAAAAVPDPVLGRPPHLRRAPRPPGPSHAAPPRPPPLLFPRPPAPPPAVGGRGARPGAGRAPLPPTPVGRGPGRSHAEET